MVEAEAAFVWAARVVVLDAVSLEEFVVSVVHFDREVDHDLVLWLSEDDARAVLEVDRICGREHGVHGLCVEVVWVVWEAELVGNGSAREFCCCCSHGVCIQSFTRWFGRAL